ncbi:MAG: hypothetical protein [Bacteriophage sp.]|nr:MAG: hypothetical protein [Bacteriophage sp.]
MMISSEPLKKITYDFQEGIYLSLPYIKPLYPEFF